MLKETRNLLFAALAACSRPLLVVVVPILFLVAVVFCADKLPSAWRVEKVKYHEDGRLREIKGDLTPAGEFNSPRDLAWAFLEQNAKTFGISDPRETLKVQFVPEHSDAAEVWLCQYYHGIQFSYPPAFIIHSVHNRIVLVQSDYCPKVASDTTPRIDSTAAMSILMSSGQCQPDSVMNLRSTLVIYHGHGQCRLAWEVRQGAARYYVDALEGKLLFVFTGEM